MLPKKVTASAWFGPKVSSKCPLDPGAENWLREVKLRPPRLPLLAGPLPDPTNWHDDDVGWSILLAHRNDLNGRQLAEPDPESEFEPIRRLWEARGCPPIYRFDRARASKLRRHDARGEINEQDLDNAQTACGIGVDQVPFYLLICGSPHDVPWEIQFTLNLSRAVGRLDLPKEGLDRYITCLLNGWTESDVNPFKTVVWSTSCDWVTKVMKVAVAEELCKRFHGDSDLRNEAECLFDHQATVGALRTALSQRPGLIVTTSHGCMDWTRPGLTERLGVPVDNDYNLLMPVPLLDEWQPDGAIWLGLACCSAGARSRNSFDGLLTVTSPEHHAIDRVAREIGSMVAPLPQALLGAQRPLRAFIGHVEPTFDRRWYDESTGQRLAHALVDAFYQHLYQAKSEPIGWCLREHFAEYGPLRDGVDAGKEAWNRNEPDGPRQVLDAALRALDVRNLVILGDPTVALDFSRCPTPRASREGAPQNDDLDR